MLKKPQPIYYEIKYWPGISIGFGIKKGNPGHFIIFYDKNDNKIASYRYELKKREIEFVTGSSKKIYYVKTIMPEIELIDNEPNFPLDLSKVKLKSKL